jgi:hypothetical protein
MNTVAAIQVYKEYDETLDILITTNAIREWSVHRDFLGFGEFAMEFRIKKETWDNLIKAIQNNAKHFIAS